jgi:hypothetical protein
VRFAWFSRLLENLELAEDFNVAEDAENGAAAFFFRETVAINHC